MNNKQTCITNGEQFLNQMCECFTTIGLNLLNLLTKFIKFIQKVYYKSVIKF